MEVSDNSLSNPSVMEDPSKLRSKGAIFYSGHCKTNVSRATYYCHKRHLCNQFNHTWYFPVAFERGDQKIDTAYMLDCANATESFKCKQLWPN